MIVLKTGISDMETAAKAAVVVLRHGGVIAYPTETTYGLGCDPRDAKAVAKIYRIKGREKKKPLLLVAADVDQVKKVADVGVGGRSSARRIMERYWPGPLTLVLPAKTGASISKAITPRGEVAIRVSSAEFVRRICEAYGFPIVSTSANRSGEPDCRSGRRIKEVFSGAKYVPDLLIDFGALPRRKLSTVARVKADGAVEVLRPGAVRVDVLDGIHGQA